MKHVPTTNYVLLIDERNEFLFSFAETMSRKYWDPSIKSKNLDSFVLRVSKIYSSSGVCLIFETFSRNNLARNHK